MFKHIFINSLKTFLRNKAAIFWTLIFPIILATFFNLAFSNLNKIGEFEVINIAVVDNDNFQNEIYFKSLIEELSKKSDDQVFNTKYVSEEIAKELLKEDEISGYLIVNEKIDIYIRNNGIEESTIKSIIDNYYQLTSVIENISIEKQTAIAAGVLDKVNENNNYFNKATNKEIDEIIISYYALIGMICLYGGMFGLTATKTSEANLSTKGARVNIAPIKKLKFLLSSLFSGFIIHYFEVLILLAYLAFVLKINFGSQIYLILLITFIGSLAGTALGVLIGVSNRKSENLKIGILISLTMLFCFLSGMMGNVTVTYLIATKLPILAKINPVNLITDGLYSLYYYDNLNRFVDNLFYLGLFTIIMMGLSYMFVRRKKYDSI